MLIAVLVFYVLIKRKGFSKPLALAALGGDVIVFAVLIFHGMTDPILLMEAIPTFFILYDIGYFFVFCFRKSKESVAGSRDLVKKRKKFKENMKAAETNRNVKTYKGAKKK